MNYGELITGALVAIFGFVLALNVRGCAEVVADFLGTWISSAFHHNDHSLRIPAALFAVWGSILALINLKILFFGF
ncbi:hypothetical protein ABT269_38515 [Streptomyces viridosporus]|uniref:hypothetical protein n=1 Tax=Streptomyces viridosporus TaxID=67581 RepID=UPI00332CFD34